MSLESHTRVLAKHFVISAYRSVAGLKLRRLDRVHNRAISLSFLVAIIDPF